MNDNPGNHQADQKPLGLYIHIPFCVKKCLYCDFLSFGGISSEIQEAYFRSLFREIEHYSKVYSKEYYVDTIFIGGGTPSLADEGLINELMLAVRYGFAIGTDAEITIESNPKTLTKHKLKTYLASGVNRLSIGAQSFDDRLLRYMGRVHTAEDFLTTYFLARECGFHNINIDLMFAIPGQTMDIWLDTLKKAVSLTPEHLSFYSLQLEEGTPFFSMFQEGSLQEVDDVLDREMYHRAIETLRENGYLHYEISNVAREGYQCRHNLKYWSMEEYLGLGLGAHSFLGGTRYSNITDLGEYIQIGGSRSTPAGRYEAVQAGEGSERALAGSAFVAWQHENVREDNISEYLFTGMRKIRGIDLTDFRERFGVTLESIHGKVLEKYRQEGLVEVADDRLHFTEKGIDISNMVLAEFV